MGTLTKHINTKHNPKPSSLKELGKGLFGFAFDVIPGKIESAEELRLEWKNKKNNKNTTKEEIQKTSQENKEKCNYSLTY